MSISTEYEEPSKIASNCLVCLLQFFVKLFFLAIPIRGHCNHFKGDAYYDQSSSKVFHAVGMNIAFIFTLYYPLQGILSTCYTISSDCIYFVDWIAIVFCGVVMINIFFYNIRSAIQELNGLTKIFKNKTFYGIKNFMCESSSITLVRYQKRHVFFITFFGILLETPLLYIRDETPYHQFLILGIFSNFHFQLIVFIRYKLILMRKIFNSILCSMKDVLEHAKAKNEYTIENKIRKIRHLYLEIWKVLRNYNEFFNPALFIWLGSMTFVLTLNAYISLLLTLRNFNEQVLFGIFTTFSGIFVLGLISRAFGGFQDLVSIKFSVYIEYLYICVDLMTVSIIGVEVSFTEKKIFMKVSRKEVCLLNVDINFDYGTAQLTVRTVCYRKVLNEHRSRKI